MSSETTAVRRGHQLNEASLTQWLITNVPEVSGTLRRNPSALSIRQFSNGQSNPTFLITIAHPSSPVSFVLRKQPPGKLLASAHAVDREFKVLTALGSTGSKGFPVPKAMAFCSDKSVLGTPFFIMEHLSGRIFRDPLLGDINSPSMRNELYMKGVDALAHLHSISPSDVGLERYGARGNYYGRQIHVWSAMYKKTATGTITSMDNLMNWLPKNIPTGGALADLRTIVHGDYRIDNMVFDSHSSTISGVLDWELSTLGHPLGDLAYYLIPYYFPASESFQLGSVIFAGFQGLDLTAKGLPQAEALIQAYLKALRTRLSSRSNNPIHLPDNIRSIPNWHFYIAFGMFRLASICQGIYKRSLQGNASSAVAREMGLKASVFADAGWRVVTQALASSNGSNNGSSAPSRTLAPSEDRSWMMNGVAAARSMGLLSDKGLAMAKTLAKFMAEDVFPAEDVWETQVEAGGWLKAPAVMETLKAKAKTLGLWNVFMPKNHHGLGPGLSTTDYAVLAEIMGSSLLGPEACNCNAPDTGNMEVFLHFASDEQRAKWLPGLVDGTIRSCFAMTEPAVASSDATNICTRIEKDGDDYVITGRKWWISGAGHPNAKICLLMGKTDPTAQRHKQQSVILVPMDAPGVKKIRPMRVFGYDDAPFGHWELEFDHVRVPASNVILGPGRGFEIGQGRLGPGRVHHCMRSVGMAERALSMMKTRAQTRVVFGAPISAQSSVREQIARCRVDIDQTRLLTLYCAQLMDTLGAQSAPARKAIAMIKIAAPEMACRVVDISMQVHGAAGLSQDSQLSRMFAGARSLRIADGPDAVHLRTIARMELQSGRKRSSRLRSKL